MNSSEYTQYQHRHNFAIWAAARASQRGFAKVQDLKQALESSTIDEFIKYPCLENEFDDYHRKWCNQIRSNLKKQGIDNATYGRAAKLVNVYLKSMVVLKDLSSEAARFIHPPIDRILLQNIANCSKHQRLSETDRRKIRNTKWTKLDENSYFDVLSILRQVIGKRPFWKIEQYWDVIPNKPS